MQNVYIQKAINPKIVIEKDGQVYKALIDENGVKPNGLLWGSDSFDFSKYVKAEEYRLTIPDKKIVEEAFGAVEKEIDSIYESARRKIEEALKKHRGRVISEFEVREKLFNEMEKLAVIVKYNEFEIDLTDIETLFEDVKEAKKWVEEYKSNVLCVGENIDAHIDVYDVDSAELQGLYLRIKYLEVDEEKTRSTLRRKIINDKMLELFGYVVSDCEAVREWLDGYLTDKGLERRLNPLTPRIC